MKTVGYLPPKGEKKDGGNKTAENKAKETEPKKATAKSGK